MMIMPNSVWDISLLLLGESDTYEPDYHTHDESICRQQAVLAEEDAHQARRNGACTCSGLLIPDTDLGENPRRERGV